MIQRKVEGWILVANGKECRIFTRNFTTGVLDIVEEFHSEESRPHDRDIRANRPGRVFESAQPMRHAMEPKIRFDDQVRQGFAREIAEFLNEAALQDRFHALTIAMSLPMLGEFRPYVSAHVQEKIVIQVNKDLTHIPPHELPEYLYQKAG